MAIGNPEASNRSEIAHWEFTCGIDPGKLRMDNAHIYSACRCRCDFCSPCSVFLLHGTFLVANAFMQLLLVCANVLLLA